jgi:hypothetical protein
MANVNPKRLLVQDEQEAERPELVTIS